MSSPIVPPELFCPKCERSTAAVVEHSSPLGSYTTVECYHPDCRHRYLTDPVTPKEKKRA